MKNNLAIYQCKRTVAAGRITDTYPEGMHNTRIEVVDADGKLVFLDVGRNWFEFHRPEAGGYFVDFSDGHTAFIAKGDFERMFDLDPDFREVDPPGDSFGSAAQWKEKAQDWAAECERLKKQELGMVPPPLMVYDPKDGMREVYPSEARQYREWHGMVAWLYNPFTGESRTPEAVGTDPFGLLIVAPAKDAAPAEGHHV